MGYIRHDAIIITCWDMDRLRPVHEFAKSLNLPVTDIVEGRVNGYCTFLVAPDGSKEGWSESDEGDKARTALIAWLREHRSEYWPDWIHVSYGGDDPERCSIVDYTTNDVQDVV